ncbi:MAG: dienelactone hydrolase family protein [Gammaproteobacteria bacterium]|nr:dienelactone hydrolase family protein [Gammaproteobacteria bacterium]
MNMPYAGRPALVLSALCALICLSACGPSERSGGADSAARDNVDAMSREHADDVGTPSDAAVIAPERAVVAETLPYAEVNNELVYGHFVFPADMVDPLPALIVLHEWWGLNDGVRAMADRLAGEGYIVLALDLFGGNSATTPAEARELMMSVVEDPESANENIRQAYRFLQEVADAPRVGTLGWCFGGGWSLNAAMLLPDEIDAAVIYYGQVTDDEERLRLINAPILGLFGEDDNGIPVESVRSFESALERLRKNFKIEVYPGAQHAFANPSGRNYNAEVAEQAWQETLAFLDLHLSISD